MSPSQQTSLQSVVSDLPDYNPQSLRVDQAIAIMRNFVQPMAQALEVEEVDIFKALNRVLATDIISPIDVPAADNSAMDGYAFSGTSITSQETTTLKLIGTGLAGNAFTGQVGAGQCIRITTGAIMPAGCDTMIPQELVRVDGETISFTSSSIRAGDNRRLKGEDLKAGFPALRAGRIIRPADLGLIASLGIGRIPVKRKLRVGFFSTGDELRSIGETLDHGSVYDSNRYTVFGMLQRLGMELKDYGVIQDQPDELKRAFATAALECDAIITSGGVSVGEADFTKQIMRELGDVTFWQIAMRPGRPMAFGSIAVNNRPAVLFGLPGNPVAVMVTFYQFVRPTLMAMSSAQGQEPLTIKVKSAEAIRKKPGRTEFQRVILRTADDGSREVLITGSQGSGVLRSMSEADCFIVLGHNQDSIQAGDWVDVMLFEGLI